MMQIGCSQRDRIRRIVCDNDVAQRALTSVPDPGPASEYISPQR